MILVVRTDSLSIRLREQPDGKASRGAVKFNMTEPISKSTFDTDYYYMDWRPFGPKWLIIIDPEIMSKYCTTGQSLPKSPLTTTFLARLLGKNNMVSLEGQEWKLMRSIFNPGFAATHLISLVPYMVDSGLILLDILHQKAKTNELFRLDSVTARYAIDIIGKIAMDTDFDSQRQTHPIVETFRHQVDLMPTVSGVNPLESLNMVRPVRLWWNMRKLNKLIGDEVDKRIALRATEVKANGSNNGKPSSSKDRKRSIVDLALDAYEKDIGTTPSGNPSSFSSPKMTSWFRTTAIDSIKTFIFAGHDTTSSTIAYTLYLLHLHPKVTKRLSAELDTVFGPDSTGRSIAEQIRANAHTINKLDYLNVVLKEVLRLFPPASTLRGFSSHNQSQVKDLVFTDPQTNRSFPMKDFAMWPLAHSAHRHEAYFPDPIKFIPERFLPNETPYPHAKLHTPAGKEAWRPFEKGPRNCIGQELAMIESKVVLATIVKDLDFTPEYDGVPIETWTPIETVDEYRDMRPGVETMTIEGHRPYQVLAGAANPKDGMTGRVRLRRE